MIKLLIEKYTDMLSAMKENRKENQNLDSYLYSDAEAAMDDTEISMVAKFLKDLKSIA